MKQVARILSLATAAFILYVIFILGMIALTEGYHPLYPLIDTQHTAGYSIGKFDRVKPGDTEDKVLSILGPPLFTEEDSLSGAVTISYTGDGRLLYHPGKDGTQGYDDFAWYRSSITFDRKKKVVAIDKGWSHD